MITATEIMRTGLISINTDVKIDQLLIFVSYGTHTMNYFVSLGIFMHRGCGIQR